jgi:hypothetical protein
MNGENGFEVMALMPAARAGAFAAAGAPAGRPGKVPEWVVIKKNRF